MTGINVSNQNCYAIQEQVDVILLYLSSFKAKVMHEHITVSVMENTVILSIAVSSHKSLLHCAILDKKTCANFFQRLWSDK